MSRRPQRAAGPDGQDVLERRQATAEAAEKVVRELTAVARRGPKETAGPDGPRKMSPAFSHVDVLVLLILDMLMAPEDVEEDTDALAAPSARTMEHLAHYSSTHINSSLSKLQVHGFVRVLRSPVVKGWTQTYLYALTDDGRALLGRLFPPPPR